MDGHWGDGVAALQLLSGVAASKWGGRRGHMAEIVNLRRARKRAMRRSEEERAAQRRVSHGMSKSDRVLAEAEGVRFRRELDAHRIDTGESDEIAGR
jgi:hypothetical protein